MITAPFNTPRRVASALLALCVLVPSASVHAAYLQKHVSARTYVALNYKKSASQNNTHPWHNFNRAVTVPAGQRRWIVSKLVLTNVNALRGVEVSPTVYCYPAGVTPGPKGEGFVKALVSGRNSYAGNRPPIYTRGIIEAPASGPLTCHFGMFLKHHTSNYKDGNGTATVGTGSYISDQYATLSLGSNATVLPSAVLNTTTTYVRSGIYTAPANARRVHARGDFAATNCYSNRQKQCLDPSARILKGVQTSLVGWQMSLHQLNRDGSVCQTRTSPLAGRLVNNVIHHEDFVADQVNMPVSAACTSRNFQAVLRLTANVNHNSWVLEANNQTRVDVIGTTSNVTDPD